VRNINLWDLWESEDIARLQIEVVSLIEVVLANSQRGLKTKGWCNCRQCSAKKPRKPITVATFHEHMLLEDLIRREDEEEAAELEARRSRGHVQDET
jgi:hypothetical protein